MKNMPQSGHTPQLKKIMKDMISLIFDNLSRYPFELITTATNTQKFHADQKEGKKSTPA